MDSSCKTVAGVVAGLNNLLFGLELSNRANGTEDLLPHDRHIFSYIREDRRLDEVSLPTATQSGLPSHLHVEITIEVVQAHLVVDLTIRGVRLVGVFFGEACLQVGVEVLRGNQRSVCFCYK